MFTYTSYSPDGDDLGEVTYAEQIKVEEGDEPEASVRMGFELAGPVKSESDARSGMTRNGSQSSRAPCPG